MRVLNRCESTDLIGLQSTIDKLRGFKVGDVITNTVLYKLASVVRSSQVAGHMRAMISDMQRDVHGFATSLEKQVSTSEARAEKAVEEGVFQARQE